MPEVILNNQNFEEEVLKSDKPVLVDFYATWCPPCQMIAPIIEELAEEYRGKIKIGKLKVDQNQEIAQKYEVMSVPTLIIFKDGEIIEQLVGLRSKEELKERLDNLR